MLHPRTSGLAPRPRRNERGAVALPLPMQPNIPVTPPEPPRPVPTPGIPDLPPPPAPDGDPPPMPGPPDGDPPARDPEQPQRLPGQPSRPVVEPPDSPNRRDH
jgi:hypothetical protein